MSYKQDVKHYILLHYKRDIKYKTMNDITKEAASRHIRNINAYIINSFNTCDNDNRSGAHVLTPLLFEMLSIGHHDINAYERNPIPDEPVKAAFAFKMLIGVNNGV